MIVCSCFGVSKIWEIFTTDKWLIGCGCFLIFSLSIRKRVLAGLWLPGISFFSEAGNSTFEKSALCSKNQTTYLKMKNTKVRKRVLTNPWLPGISFFWEAGIPTFENCRAGASPKMINTRLKALFKLTAIRGRVVLPEITWCSHNVSQCFNLSALSNILQNDRA